MTIMTKCLGSLIGHFKIIQEMKSSALMHSYSVATVMQWLNALNSESVWTNFHNKNVAGSILAQDIFLNRKMSNKQQNIHTNRSEFIKVIKCILFQFIWFYYNFIELCEKMKFLLLFSAAKNYILVLFWAIQFILASPLRISFHSNIIRFNFTI